MAHRSRWLGFAAALGAVAVFMGSVCAQDTPRQNPVRDAGRTAQDAVRQAGRNARDAAQETGRNVRDAAQETGRAARDAAQETGRTIRDPAPETGRIARENVDAGTATRLQGTVVRVDAPQNQFWVRTVEGKEVAVFADPQTTYRLGTQDARLDSLREGTRLDIAYDMRGNRYFANSVALWQQTDRDYGATATRTERTARYAEPDDAGAGFTRLHGRITQVYINPTQFVLRTDDGRETTVFVDSRQDVSVAVENRDGRYYLKSFGMNEGRAAVRTNEERRNYVDSATTATRTTGGTTVEGTIVRVQGTDNQFVMRTADGQEIVLYSDPQAVIRYDNRVVPFTELRPGTPATVIYQPSGNRKVVRSITGRRR